MSIFNAFISMRDQPFTEEGLDLWEFVGRCYRNVGWSDDFIKSDLERLQSQQITSVNRLFEGIQLGYGYQVARILDDIQVL